MPSDEITDERLHELYVEKSLTVADVAKRLGRQKSWVREQLTETDFYEPKLSTILEDLDPGDVGDPVDPPEPSERRLGGESA